MSENKVLKAGDVGEFAKLSNYKTIGELNMAFSSWLYDFKRELKLSEEKLAFFFKDWSCKYKGVVYIKHETIAEKTGFSVKTIQRAIKRFVELGLISVYETRTSIKSKTPKGKGNPKGRGHNVYVINPIEPIDFEALRTKSEKNSSAAPESTSESTPEKPVVQSVVQSVVSSRSMPEKPFTPTLQGAKNEPDTIFAYTSFSKRIKDKDISTYADNINMVFEEVDKIGHWIPETFKNKALLLLNTADNVNAAYSIIRKKVLKEKLFAYSKEDVNEFARLTINAYHVQEKELQRIGETIEKPLAYVTGIIKGILEDRRNVELEERKRIQKNEIIEIYSGNESDDSEPIFTQLRTFKPSFYNWLVDLG